MHPNSFSTVLTFDHSAEVPCKRRHSSVPESHKRTDHPSNACVALCVYHLRPNACKRCGRIAPPRLFTARSPSSAVAYQPRAESMAPLLSSHFTFAINSATLIKLAPVQVPPRNFCRHGRNWLGSFYSQLSQTASASNRHFNSC